MKRYGTKIILLGMISILFTACTNTSSNNDSASTNNSKYNQIELAMTVNGTDIQIDTLVANKFAELVEEGSNGNVTISVFSNDQLAGGNATKGIEMISEGSVDLAAYASSVTSVLDENLLIGTIPWTFDNYQDAKEVIDKTGGAYYQKLLEPHNITYLGSFHNGFRQITNDKRSIKTPADLKGLKIRVPGGEVYLKFFKAFGADPIAMSWSEVFTALQQGTIDGQENGVSITDTAKMYEVQKHMTLWNYTYENDLFMANTRIWNMLNAETQALLMEKAKEACEWGRDRIEMEQEELVAKFKEKGMDVVELTPEELEPFKAIVTDLRQTFIQKYGEEACSAFEIQ